MPYCSRGFNDNIMKQIFNHKELLGKTISQVLMPEDYFEDMWIKFTDNSFVVLKTNNLSVGFEQDKYTLTICEYNKDNTNEELLKLGLITKQEHNLAVQEQDIKYENERKEREFRINQEIERQEIELLNKLKAKHGHL